MLLDPAADVFAGGWSDVSSERYLLHIVVSTLPSELMSVLQLVAVGLLSIWLLSICTESTLQGNQNGQGEKIYENHL